MNIFLQEELQQKKTAILQELTLAVGNASHCYMRRSKMCFFLRYISQWTTDYKIMMINQLEEIILAYSHILIHRNEKESYPLNYLTS